MPLNLYRRHYRSRGKCIGGHPPDSRSYEPEELRRSWRKCYCPIYADGTLGGKFNRRNTKKASWPEAKIVAAEWEARGAWDAPETSTPAPALAPDPPQLESSKPSITIQFATDAYLANRAGRDIAPVTVRKYKTFVKQLREFADDKGYVILEQLEITDMDEFYSRWKDGIRAKAKKLERLKGFFNFCVKRKWVAENSASDLDPPVGSGVSFIQTARRDLSWRSTGRTAIRSTTSFRSTSPQGGSSASIFLELRLGASARWSINIRSPGSKFTLGSPSNTASRRATG
jgi:hypothetical protein